MKETAFLHDADVWQIIEPEDIWVYNKLQIAKMQGLQCGPAGTRVPCDGLYIVRPIVNFSGMCAGAEVKRLTSSDLSKVPLGYFWCELLEGQQISVDYVEGLPVVSYQPERIKDDPLYKFSKWKKRDKRGWSLPNWLQPLAQRYSRINVEYIDKKVIEVHLRGSPDPGVEEFIPVWSSDPNNSRQGYKYIESYDDADGNLQDPRLGFLIKE